MKTMQQLLYDAGSRIKQEITKFRVVNPTQSSVPMHEERDAVYIATGGKYRTAPQSSAPQSSGALVTFGSGPLPSQQALVSAMTDATKQAQQPGEPTPEELDELLALTPIGRSILAERVAASQEAAPDTTQRTPEHEAALNTALTALQAQIRSTQAQSLALVKEQEERESAPEVIDPLLALTLTGRAILGDRPLPMPDAETTALLQLTPLGRGILAQIEQEGK